MKRHVLAFVAIALAVGCGDQPLSNEPLLGPTVSPAASQRTGITSAEGTPQSGGLLALGSATADEVELTLLDPGTQPSDHTQLVLASPANAGTADWEFAVQASNGDLRLTGPSTTLPNGRFAFGITTNFLVIVEKIWVTAMPVVGGSSTLCASGLNEIGRCTSSLRYKQDVEDLDRGLATVLQLSPRMFRWKADSGTVGNEDLGFIAEEVAALDPLLANYDEEGVPSGVKYRHMTALLTQGIQELSQIVDQQGATIAGQGQEIAELKLLVTELLQNATITQHGGAQ